MGAKTTIFHPKDYPLRDYPKVRAVEFPSELTVAYAVCSRKCGSRQFIVDGSTQVCEYCGCLMFRTEVRRYILEPAIRAFGKGAKSRRAPQKKKPNKALEPTPGSVTCRADARPAPVPVVAHL